MKFYLLICEQYRAGGTIFPAPHKCVPLAEILNNTIPMTAAIRILNKNGITIAADSAVTVTGGNSKTFTTPQVKSSVSKFHPAGKMIYSSLSPATSFRGPEAWPGTLRI